jgi:hypothetical protein
MGYPQMPAPTLIELVANLNTAKEMRIKMRDSLLAPRRRFGNVRLLYWYLVDEL